jgi:uncharacterized membrane protein
MRHIIVLTGDQVDSILGATVQLTRYSADSRLVLQDGSREAGAEISGVGLLTNNQVNLVASVVCAGFVGWLGA